MNPHVPAQEIEAARQDLSEAAWSQEYDARFVSREGVVFRRILDTIAEPPTNVAAVAIGVDCQDDFEAERARAELEYATRAERVPYHPHYAASPFLRLGLIQQVFFAYCTQARNACRAGEWTPAQVSRSVEAAWPRIFNFYVTREYGAITEKQKSMLRVALRATITDHQRWRQHLSDLAGLANKGERAASTAWTADDARKAKRKRGRPQLILDKNKAAALKVKEHGGTNKDAAKALYNVAVPNCTAGEERPNHPAALQAEA